MKEIGVKELDGDVRLYSGNGNIAVLRMHNEKYEYYPYLLPNRRNSCVL